MRLIERFKRLSLWNKLGSLGSIASIVGLPGCVASIVVGILGVVLTVYYSRLAPSPSAPAIIFNVNPDIRQHQEPDVGEVIHCAKKQTALRFTEITTLPQAVNRKSPTDENAGRQHPLGKEETATIRFTVANHGESRVGSHQRGVLGRQSSGGAVFRLDDGPYRCHWSWRACSSGDGHVCCRRRDSRPSQHRECRQVHARNSPCGSCHPDCADAEKNPHFVTGRLRLHYAQSSLTSEPIALEIHSETQANRIE